MKRNLLALVLITFFMNTSTAFAFTTEMEDEMHHGNLKNDGLVRFLKKASRYHHSPLSYKREAKKYLFQEVDLQRDSEGYYIKDVYCNFIVRGVGPRKSPRNGIMNAEHTWPQSKGSKREPFRGDLHHLFPADTRANSTRGNHPFGELVDPQDVSTDCTASQKGHIANPSGGSSGKRGFQPPPEHRGNVARALFYGAVAYNYHISELEEYYLRKWHKEDPVDDEEIERNDAVESAQGNRNPFIDYPNIVDRIEDF